MRVAIFTESLPPQNDGVSHTFSKLAETLEHQHITYNFFSPFKPGADVSWNDKVHPVKSFKFPLYKYYRIGLPYFDNLIETLDNLKPDIIHVASPTPLSIFGQDYAKKHNIPVVSSYHTNFVSYFRYYGLQKIEGLGWSILRWFHNRGMATYVPSQDTANELIEQGFNNVELWQRGINFEQFSPEKRSDALRKSIGAEHVPVLLFVGRLVKEKDLDDVISADRYLKEWNQKYKIVIVGDGPMRPELEESLPDAHFTGFVKKNELGQWYASSDIFIFPSTTETFGNVILEAFASGIPAIGVRKGGVQDLITDGKTGYLTEPNNPREFAERIQNLLNTPALFQYYKQNALAEAKEKSWDSINQKLLNSYQQVLRKYHSGN